MIRFLFGFTILGTAFLTLMLFCLGIHPSGLEWVAVLGTSAWCILMGVLGSLGSNVHA